MLKWAYILSPLIKKKINLIKYYGRKLSFMILALKIELTAGATILKLIFGNLDMSIWANISRTYSKKQYKHILFLSKKSILSSIFGKKSRILILGLKIELIVGAKILKLNFYPLYLIKLIFFKSKVLEYLFLYLCVKWKLIWTYLSGQNNQSWLFSSQTIP